MERFFLWCAYHIVQIVLVILSLWVIYSIYLILKALVLAMIDITFGTNLGWEDAFGSE